MTPFHTADGVKLEVGMKFWVHDTNTDRVVQHEVAEISPTGFKVIYKEPEPDGYIGSRVNGVYFHKRNAELCQWRWLNGFD